MLRIKTFFGLVSKLLKMFQLKCRICSHSTLHPPQQPKAVQDLLQPSALWTISSSSLRQMQSIISMALAQITQVPTTTTVNQYLLRPQWAVQINSPLCSCPRGSCFNLTREYGSWDGI